MKNGTIIELDKELRIILTEKLSFKTKRELRKVQSQISDKAHSIYKKRDDIILKITNGTGNITPTLDDGKPNPLIEQFSAKWNEVMKEDCEDDFSFNLLPVSLVSSLESEKDYPNLDIFIFKL